MRPSPKRVAGLRHKSKAQLSGALNTGVMLHWSTNPNISSQVRLHKGERLQSPSAELSADYCVVHAHLRGVVILTCAQNCTCLGCALCCRLQSDLQVGDQRCLACDADSCCPDCLETWLYNIHLLRTGSSTRTPACAHSYLHCSLCVPMPQQPGCDALSRAGVTAGGPPQLTTLLQSVWGMEQHQSLTAR